MTQSATSSARSFTPTDSITAKLYELLRNSPRCVLNKLIQTFQVISPHSMLTERAVKCHTQLKTDLRSSMSQKSVNSRMCIALNSSGTANFDPRPAVARFLMVKNRRNRNPEYGRYTRRISSPRITLYKGQFWGPIRTKISKYVYYTFDFCVNIFKF